MLCGRVSVLPIPMAACCASVFFKEVHWLKPFPLSLRHQSPFVTLCDFTQSTRLDPPESEGCLVFVSP